MAANASHKLDTLAIHAGQAPDPVHGAVMTPIVLSSTFAQEGPGGHKGYDYSRAGNPTRTALEECVAALEGGTHGIAYASGCAATTAILMTLRPGDHVIVGDDVYGGTFRIFDKVLKEFGIDATFLDLGDLAAVERARKPSTKMLWLETPSNPMLKLFDIAALTAWARTAGLRSIVDNTFASPVLQRPLALGADAVVHSSTKYLNGHSDVVGGIVVTSDDAFAERLHFLQKATGACPSPFDCYLVLRGIKTLGVRVRQATANAHALAAFLERHPAVEKVIYPGLPSHPQHELAKRQMRDAGAMLSFVVKGGFPGADAFLRAVKIFTCAESLGGVESLAEHPASMTHASIPADQREALGIADGLVRLSIGVEDVEDLREDLAHALSAAR
jgi:cystathionine beta-lyase/cystathionine gamma-synthase